MRLEVGAAAERPDKVHENPLCSKYYFVRCLGKSRVVSAEDSKTLAATADVKDAKTAAAAAAAMSDGVAASSIGAPAAVGGPAEESSVKIESELFSTMRAAVEPLKAAIRALGGFQLPLAGVRARLVRKAKEDPALQQHHLDLEVQMKLVEDFLSSCRSAVAEAMALDRDDPNDQLLRDTLEQLGDCREKCLAHTAGIYNTYMYIYMYV